MRKSTWISILIVTEYGIFSQHYVFYIKNHVVDKKLDVSTSLEWGKMFSL
jgi:hypothetical protein